MKEFVEKLIDRLEVLKIMHLDMANDNTGVLSEYDKNSHIHFAGCYSKSIEIVNQLAEEYNNGWIPCSERLPTVETKVLILAKRKYRDGSFKNIITTAMYEDGTMLENDSCWRWEDIEGEWDEENDCYIIQEGWWEDKMYNADGELNHLIDDEVIAWQPLPAPYQKGE